MAEIIITQNDRRRQVTAIGAEPSVTFDFPIFEEDQISVLRTAFDTGLTTPLVLNIDYTVSGIGVQSGGTVIFDTVVFPTGLAAGDVITLSGDAPIKRTTDFQTVGDYFAADINRELDTITIVQQELATKAAMTIHTRPEDTTDEDDLLLPLPADRASQVLSFDPTGTVVTSALGTIPSLPVSAFMAVVVGAANAPSARDFQQTWKLGALAGGSVDAITAVIGATSLVDGMIAIVRAIGANTIAAVTFDLDSLGVKAVVKGNNQLLVAGDISVLNDEAIFEFNTAFDKWVLLNPAVPSTARRIGQLALVKEFANGWHWIETKTAAADATIDMNLPSGFDAYRVTYSMAPSNDDVSHQVRLQTFGGAFRTGASDYSWSHPGHISIATGKGVGQTNAAAIRLFDDAAAALQSVGNAPGEGVAGSIYIQSARDVARRTLIQGNSVHTTAGNETAAVANGGQVRTAEDNDAIRFMFEAFDIQTGTFTLEGLRTNAV